MKLGPATYYVDQDAGTFPYFSLTLRSRIKQKMAVNAVVVGEAGSGKSYCAFTLAKMLDPTFSVDQIVFTYSDYMKAIIDLPMGKPIVFDEPSYAMGKRDWYKQLNKVLVQTIESQRFKVHPLIIPIINITLLDKTIRSHLLQYAVVILRRGLAFVYRISASQWEEKVYHNYLCRFRWPLLGKCKRPSCLGCRKVKRVCQEFRAQYERKKAKVQDRRYQQAEEEAGKLETKEWSLNQLTAVAHSWREEIIDADRKLIVKKMRLLFNKRLNLHVSTGRGYDIRESLLYDYPDQYTKDR